MLGEIELYFFQRNEFEEVIMDDVRVEYVEYLTSTDLMTKAFQMMRETGAQDVSFGRAIERDEKGSIVYGNVTKKR